MFHPLLVEAEKAWWNCAILPILFFGRCSFFWRVWTSSARNKQAQLFQPAAQYQSSLVSLVSSSWQLNCTSLQWFWRLVAWSHAICMLTCSFFPQSSVLLLSYALMTEVWVNDGKGAIRVGGQHFLKFQSLLFIETELVYQGNASLSGWPEKRPIGLWLNGETIATVLCLYFKK